MLSNGFTMRDGYSVYDHQVAGHRFETGKQGMLVDINGRVLKPIQAPPRGEREVQFYNNLFGREVLDETTLKLQQFVPTFYGVRKVVFPELSLKDKYIVLENLTRHFDKPCILDVKIGKCVTDQFATRAKQERSFRKYPEQETFGFRILGMKVYNSSCGNFKSYDKTFGKNLKTREQVLQGLKEFFPQELVGRGHIEEILRHLEKIKAWSLEQRTFRLFSSSILIVYEGNEKSSSSSLVAENCKGECTNASYDTLKKDESWQGRTDDCSEGCQARNDATNVMDLRVKSCEEPLILQNDCSVNKFDCAPEDVIDSQHRKHELSIRLVDFAHTYIGTYDSPDENYLFGLNNLICYFKQLIRCGQ